jgi:membrane dipeptidase
VSLPTQGLFDAHLHLDLLPNWMSARNRWQNHLFTLEYFQSIQKPVVLNVAIYPSWRSSFPELLHQIEKFCAFINNHPEVYFIKSKKDLHNLRGVGVLMHVESARILSEPQKEIKALFDLGVKGIIPVHFLNNRFGNSCDDPRNKTAKESKGLSKLGQQLVEVCNEHNMWMDVSHASDQTAFDLIAQSNFIMASHVGIRERMPKARNISMATAQQIVKKNGLIGLLPWTRLHGGKSQDFLHTVQYCQQNGLDKHLAIGTDFGAPVKTAKELNSLENIENALFKADISTENIMWRNGIQWLERVLPE